MNDHEIIRQIDDRTAEAVTHYWQTRAAQRRKQEAGGKADQGLRSAVTGGAQMDMASAFITSSSLDGLKGTYKTPADDLSMERFVKVLVAHVATFV